MYCGVVRFESAILPSGAGFRLHDINGKFDGLRSRDVFSMGIPKLDVPLIYSQGNNEQ
jgi:hypothetical protein